MKKKRLTRRKFLKTSAGTLAAASLSTVPIACQDDDKAPDELRLAVIGTGRRGQDHIAALGYLDMESALGQRKKTGYPPLPGQRVVAVADTYKANLDDGARQIQATLGEVAKYKDYRDLLDREDLDAVVIATPDHLHTQIAIAAINKGLDVYVEKSISNNLAETFELEAALQKQGRILQSGFQTQQDHMHELAANTVANGHIGKVHMVENFLHRGGEAGAWVFDEEKNGGPPRDQIEWELFQGNAPKHDYTPKRYFGWRCFWDYSTGISGDILTHIMIAVDRIVGIGVPHSASATGGIYYWKDGRETPDQFSVMFEFPEQELTVNFISTLSNSFNKTATRYMGEEGTIELDWRLRVYADRFSKKYADRIYAGTLNPNQPFVDLEDSAAGLVTKAAPSQLWLGGRGATLTTRADGEVRDTTRLHHENFHKCIRSREQPDANFATSLSSTIAAHMATTAYREKRTVHWDPVKRQII